MGAILKKLKSVVDGLGTIWTVLGWLGLASVVTGVAVSIGGALWAVITGVPIPLAIMAGFCTLVGAVYLAMAPMAYRALERVGTAKGGTISTEKINPDYKVWQQVENLPLIHAALLWCDCDPHAKIPASAASQVQTWLTVLKDAVRRGELRLAPGYDSVDRDYPEDLTNTTRSALIAFAKKRSWDPRFLRETT